MGSLSLINEIDITQVADFQKEHLEVFKEQLNTTVQLFGSTIGTSTATAGAKAIPSGVLFTAAPGVPGETGSTSSSQAPQSSIHQPMPAHFVSHAPTSHPPSAKKKNRKHYLCEQCSRKFIKKTDFDDHMSKAHNVGKDLNCPQCNKQFSSQRSKKQHIRTQHLKIFKYPCPVLNCDWKTDGKGLLDTHMVTKHGEEQKKEYRCHLCHKLFKGQNLLKRHITAGMCQVVKNFDCQQCKPPKWFKMRENLVLHVQRYHTQELSMLTCSDCNKVFGTKAALSNHMVLHRGAAVLARAKQLRKAREEKIEKGQVPPKRKRGRPSKSAPPKILPSAEQSKKKEHRKKHKQTGKYQKCPTST